MENIFEILPVQTLSEFRSSELINPTAALKSFKSNGLPDFEYNAALSAAYSMACIQEDLNAEKFVNWIKNGVNDMPDEYTDAYSLYNAYLHIRGKAMSREITNEVHTILAEPHLPKVYHGEIRTNPMYVVDKFDKIEYTACDVKKCDEELNKLFRDIELLKEETYNGTENAFFAAAIHLAFHKIQPYHNLNMPIARLMEKWYLMTVYGDEVIALPIEQNYFDNEPLYARNRRKVGKDYFNLNYARSSAFFALSAEAYK